MGLVVEGPDGDRRLEVVEEMGQMEVIEWGETVCSSDDVVGQDGDGLGLR
jgi:hypothetical protein